MKLTRKKAEELLNNGVHWKKMPDAKIKHSIAVATAAKKIAQRCNLDGKHAYVLGLIHDIGCHYGSDQHPLEGYIYMKYLGYDDEYADICLTHSFLEGDPNCTAEGLLVEGSNVRPNRIVPYQNVPDKKFVLDFLKNHNYTPYEKIINLCDLMCSDKIVGLDARMADLTSRKGVFSTTERHIATAKKLQEELERQMGCTMDDLFGKEIAKNLASGDTYFVEQKQGKNIAPVEKSQEKDDSSDEEEAENS